MTRDEAVKKIVEPYVEIPFGGALVDSLVALGILKLDEPKSARDLAREVLRSQLIGQSYISQTHIDNLLRVFDAAGLQIVEK